MRTAEQIKADKRISGQRCYAADPEKFKLRAKLWRKTHPQRGYAISKAWRARHREQYNAAQKKWRDNNIEKVKEIAHRTYCKHGAKYLEGVKKRLGMERYNARGAHHAMLRHTRKRLVTVGDLTDIQKVYRRCGELKQWFTGLVVDHIVPISKGGMHEASNLQIIYGFENNRKYNNVNYKPKVVFA